MGDTVLTPGWTSYRHRLRYQTYDVTHLIEVGGNQLEFLLGDGWFRGRFGWGRGRPYGDRLALLARLEVTLTDGRVLVLATDGTCGPSASNTGTGSLPPCRQQDPRPTAIRPKPGPAAGMPVLASCGGTDG